jgi:ethanolamine utilization protein EutP (predicted NTPase)
MQIYEGKHLIAVLTKTDLPEANAAQVAAMLRENGIKGPIFFTSIKQPESIAPLRQKLLEYQQEAESVRAREVC